MSGSRYHKCWKSNSLSKMAAWQYADSPNSATVMCASAAGGKSSEGARCGGTEGLPDHCECARDSRERNSIAENGSGALYVARGGGGRGMETWLVGMFASEMSVGSVCRGTELAELPEPEGAMESGESAAESEALGSAAAASSSANELAMDVAMGESARAERGCLVGVVAMPESGLAAAELGALLLPRERGDAGATSGEDGLGEVVRDAERWLFAGGEEERERMGEAVSASMRTAAREGDVGGEKSSSDSEPSST